MMNHSSKNPFKVEPETLIEGKWHKKQYKIIKELGSGANGIVYLAKLNSSYVALKMSDNGMSIISEVNVLKSFEKVQGSALGPSLLDVDDWEGLKGRISFYAMEYIQGPDLLTYIQEKGKVWTMVMILQLLNDLDKLHKNGWVFGDLKPDNLIVTGPPAKIRCIDVGGTTIQGRAIKEFTEFFDRGYWGLGTRKAEPSYDLFSVAMILINTAYPKRFNKTSGGLTQLREAIMKSNELQPLEEVLIKALKGDYASATQMREQLLNLINPSERRVERREPLSPSPKPENSSISQRSQSVQRQNKTVQTASRRTYIKNKHKKRGGWKETILIFVALALFYTLYIFGKLL
ncbi:MAG: protein kinase family protein [Bacillota bacterium]|nr:protein kinase family protein [Bacillota bacterium]MDP4169022.1 protein kinase family protein [Bacillota bacterium]